MRLQRLIAEKDPVFWFIVQGLGVLWRGFNLAFCKQICRNSQAAPKKTGDVLLLQFLYCLN